MSRYQLAFEVIERLTDSGWNGSPHPRTIEVNTYWTNIALRGDEVARFTQPGHQRAVPQGTEAIWTSSNGPPAKLW